MSDIVLDKIDKEKLSKYSALMVRIGIVIREEREYFKLTREQVAEKAGVHPKTLARIETGATSDTSIETLDNIAEAIGILGKRRLGLIEILFRAERLWWTFVPTVLVDQPR